MTEATETAWRELLHKHGLLPVADILEKYGVASAIDVSELKQDDFIALEALGLKPFVLMKIKRWSTSGGVTDVLPSSSTVPAAALTSSVPLTVGDGVDNAQHGTENESDGSVSNDTGERESDEDCVLIDAMETVIAHEEAGCCQRSYFVKTAYHKDAGKASWFNSRSETPRVYCRLQGHRDRRIGWSATSWIRSGSREGSGHPC